jgi:hypothetical protein
MKIKNGAISSGAPEGRNRLFVSHWCLTTARWLIATKWVIARKKVTIKELVIVKEYGIIPTMLAISRVKNR